MKLNINLDTDKNNKDQIISLVDYIFTTYGCKENVSQMKLNDDKPVVRKYYCNNPGCKKEITKDVVRFCLKPENKDRFGGKVFCLKCQGGV